MDGFKAGPASTASVLGPACPASQYLVRHRSQLWHWVSGIGLKASYTQADIEHHLQAFSSQGGTLENRELHESQSELS